jgi:spore germination protein YaaH
VNFLLILILAPQLILCQKAFMLGGWVHYGRCEKGIGTARHHLHLFDLLSPFSYEVNKSGIIWDPFKRKKKCWQELHNLCKQHNITFVPTIWWTETKIMHEILSHKEKRNAHIENILEIVDTNGFDGININYERVSNDDRNAFLSFIEDLSKKLHERGLLMHLTIGGRTSDNTISIVYPHEKKIKPVVQKQFKKLIHVSLNPGKGKDAARYKRVYSECCDQVTVMGYDEWGRPYKHSAEHLKNKYYYSHASNQWVEQILQYHLSFIPPEKLVLGVPTYGLEFKILKNKGELSFKKTRNITHPIAMELAHARRLAPTRTAGGELSFTYKTTFDERYVCYLDAQAIKEKIDLAKAYRIKGICIFTVTGNEDTHLWNVLEKELQYNPLKRKLAT